MYIDTVTSEYPLTGADIRARYPMVSFTSPFTAPSRYADVVATTPPEYDKFRFRQVEGKPVLTSGTWRQTWKTEAFTASETSVRENAERESLKAKLTDRRWTIETGGVTLPNGVKTKTGKADQDRITSTIAGMEGAGIDVVDFKAENGWTTLTLADLKAIRSFIAHHVQACFSSERSHHEAVDALTLDQLSTYDITQGWPG